MKIKLIQPKMTLRPMDSEFKRLMAPSLALLTISALTPEGNEVYIEDENVRKINFDDSPDLVGITINIDSSRRAYEIASLYRKKNITTIAGGIHASANPEEVLKYFDCVCIGEAEGQWDKILEDLKNGKLKRKYSLDKPADLSITPIPKWELIDKSKYLYNNTICASRGCPFLCEFCYNSCDYVDHSMRNRPINNVIKEIQKLETKHVMFIDDNFIGNINWTREFLKEIKPLELTWNAAVSSNIVNHPDILYQMKECGCKSLFIGFESINEKSIESVTKFQNKITQYEKLIKEIHSLGIMINASMVFGFDHDYPDVFKSTLNWLIENKIETVTSHILTPYPGTKLYKRMLKEGRIIDNDSSHYNTSHVVFKPKNMTCQELFDGYMWIYKEFYSIKNIIKRIPDTPAQRIPYLLFNILYRKYGKPISKLAAMGLMNKFGKLGRKLSYNID